jgi:hypothetical protein
MKILTSHFLATVMAALTLMVTAGSATAGRLSVNNKEFRVTWVTLRAIAGGNIIGCPVTLEGSFHSATVRKATGALIGHVSRAIVIGTEGPCTGGTVTVLSATLPWHLQYRGFTGTLPRIRTVLLRLIGVSVSVRPSGLVACLARTTEEEPAEAEALLNEVTGAITGLRPNEEAVILLENSLCGFAGEFHYGGTGQVFRLGTTNQNVSIRLI